MKKHYYWLVLLMCIWGMGSLHVQAQSPPIDVGGDTAICVTTDTIYLRAVPGGGVWSGDSVTADGRFYPNNALAAERREITLTYTLGNLVARKRFRLKMFPIVEIENFSFPVCANFRPGVQLRGNPRGGRWEGGSIGPTGLFVPSRALVGVNRITYTVDTNGCPSTAVFNQEVWDFPDVDAGPTVTLCSNSDPFTLTGQSPAEGTFTGPGVQGVVFTPTRQRIGSNILRYTYSDPNGCTNTALREVIVNDAPVVNAGRDTAVCCNTRPFNLRRVSPAGGVWSGVGVRSGGQYVPRCDSVGVHTIRYTVFNAQRTCRSADSVTIQVYDAPEQAEAGFDTTVCANSPAFNITRGVRPPGGRFFGNGVDSFGTFRPSNFVQGRQKIFYRVRNARGCSTRDSLYVTVKALPPSNAGADFAVCTGNGPTRIGDAPLPPPPSPSRYEYLWTGNNGTIGFDSINRANPLVELSNFTNAPFTREYYLRVTRIDPGNPPNCFSQDTVRVTIYPKPRAQTIPPQISRRCEGDTVWLQAVRQQGLFYQWLNATSLLNPFPDTLNTRYPATVSGTYRVILYRNVDVRGGRCADTSSGDSVFIKPKVNPVITGFGAYCNGLGRSDTLTVQPQDPNNFAYQWLRDTTFVLVGARGPVYNVTRPGWYGVLIADGSEGVICYDTSNFIRVDSLRTPFVDIVRQGNDTTFSLCTANVPLSLSAPFDSLRPRAFNYLWSDGNRTRFNRIDTAGKFWIQVSNRCGSVADTLRVTAINPTPRITILQQAAKDTSICQGIPYIIRPPQQNFYVWRDARGQELSREPTYTFPTDQRVDSVLIRLDIFSLEGCTLRDSAFVSVVECEPIVYLADAFTPQGDGINDTWRIQSYSVINVRLAVYNRWGEQVYYAGSLNDARTRPWDGRYRDRDCPSGTYQYVIEYEGLKPGSSDVLRYKRSGNVALLR